MSVVFQYKGIKPQKLQIKNIKQEITKELRQEGKETVKELKKTVRFWKGDRPKFTYDIDPKSNHVSVITGPRGSTMGVQKFEWLNKGTRRRWAVMSGDWKSKTSPGSPTSKRGRGRVVIAGRGAMRKRNIRVRPGIKARGWTTTIQKQRRKPFQNRMIKAMQRGAKMAY